MKWLHFIFILLLTSSCSKNGFPPRQYFTGESELNMAQAISENDKDTVQELLDSGAVNINRPGKSGLTYLIYAIYSRNYDMAKYLLEHGADPNAPSEFNQSLCRDESFCKYDPPKIVRYTPLTFACSRHGWGYKYMELLVSHGADVNLANPILPLNAVITKDEGNRKKVVYLLANKANLNATDIYGYSPLYETIIMQDLDLAEYFINRGADATQPNNFGSSPASWLKEDFDRHLGSNSYMTQAYYMIDRLKHEGVNFEKRSCE